MSDSFAIQWAVTHQAPLFIEFPREEYWSGLSFPSPGDLPDPGIKSSCISCLGKQILYHWATRKSQTSYTDTWNKHVNSYHSKHSIYISCCHYCSRSSVFFPSSPFHFLAFKRTLPLFCHLNFISFMSLRALSLSSRQESVTYRIWGALEG